MAASPKPKSPPKSPRTSKAIPAQPNAAVVHADTATLLAHDMIAPDAFNPRTLFDDGGIEELAASIAMDGLIQPLLVRPGGVAPATHRLVAGERRWRAIRLLIERGQWPEDRLIPVTVRDMSDEAHLRLALIENLQRRDLKPLEEARGYQRLIDEFNLTTAAVAEMVKFTQRFVQKRLQLLECDANDQRLLDEGKITIEEALRRLGNRPKPYNLPADQKVVFLEVAMMIALAEKPSFWLRLPCDSRIDDNEVFQAIEKRWVVEARGDYNTGQTMVGLAYSARRLMQELTGDEEIDAGKVAAALRAASLEAGLPEPEASETGMAGPWSTAALNAPFEISPDALAEIERRRVRDEEDKARAEAAKADAKARATQFRTLGNAVRAKVGDKPADPVLVAAIETAGVVLPVRVRDGALEDARGKTIMAKAWGSSVEDRDTACKLAALAINAACGFAKSAKPAAAEGGEEPADDDGDGEGEDDGADAEAQAEPAEAA